jgi:hypothetical protein
MATLRGDISFRYLKQFFLQLYGLAATIQILTYLEKQKCYGPDKKIPFKKQ